MLMIITRTEWVYLVEPVEHLQGKDADVVTSVAELQDVGHQALAKDQEALQDATALVADMWLLLDMDLDADHPALDTLDVDHRALDTLDVDHPALDTLEEARHLDVEVPEM
jgi:hypothetical protein